MSNCHNIYRRVESTSVSTQYLYIHYDKYWLQHTPEGIQFGPVSVVMWG